MDGGLVLKIGEERLDLCLVVVVDAAAGTVVRGIFYGLSGLEDVGRDCGKMLAWVLRVQILSCWKHVRSSLI
jgi:hypothetical protein